MKRNDGGSRIIEKGRSFGSNCPDTAFQELSPSAGRSGERALIRINGNYFVECVPSRWNRFGLSSAHLSPGSAHIGIPLCFGPRLKRANH